MKRERLCVMVFVVCLTVLTAGWSQAWAAQATLAWDPSPSQGVTGYRIYYSNSANLTDPSKRTALDAGNVTQFTVTGLTAGQNYYFAATAYDASGNESALSEKVTYMPMDTTSYSNTYVVAASADDEAGGLENQFYDWNALYATTASQQAAAIGQIVEQFFADVDADGVDDLIEYVNGTWYVRSSFYGTYTIWGSGLGIGSKTRIVGDVNGDGRSDAVMYFETAANLGQWHVALSDGNGSFAYVGCWAYTLGVGSKKQMLADVDGDGRADAVMYFETAANPGQWHVALSDPNGYFVYDGCWGATLGIGSKKQFLADVNGDGRADAVMFFDNAYNRGEWHVALSDPNGYFAYVGCWASWMGVGSKNQFLADVNGDSRADIVMFFDDATHPGDWHVAESDSDQFQFVYTGMWDTWYGKGSAAQFMADVDGDGADDAIVFFK